MERWARRVAARPPAAGLDRVVYGLAQPLVGLRVLLGDRQLLWAALVPAGLLAAFCGVVALVGDGDHLQKFYTTFAVMAPLPSVVLAGHYARLAVVARHKLGFGSAEPAIEPLGTMLKRAVMQAVLIALAVAPPSAVLRLVPGLGAAAVKIVAAVWALHWIVVDAFDSARFLRPGQTLADLAAHAQRLRSPWYVRWLRVAGERTPVAGRLIGRFAGLCDRLSVPWREEIALVEDHPPLLLGFALSTAALLALPVLNLLFRPIVIIAAAHVLGRLEAAEPDSPALPPAV